MHRRGDATGQLKAGSEGERCPEQEAPFEGANGSAAGPAAVRRQTPHILLVRDSQLRSWKTYFASKTLLEKGSVSTHTRTWDPSQGVIRI